MTCSIGEEVSNRNRKQGKRPFREIQSQLPCKPGHRLLDSARPWIEDGGSERARQRGVNGTEQEMATLQIGFAAQEMQR